MLDTIAPTASVTTATITTSGSAVVQSTETGTAYLVNTTVTVSNLDSITGAALSQWNSVAISLANTNTNLPATGLADGIYKVYAVDASGNLSSASSNSVTVDTTIPAGTFLLKWGNQGTGDGKFSGPHGVAVDGSGNVYVSEYTNHRVQKFDSSGNFLLKWGSSGTGDGKFSGPYGVAVDGSGNVYVAEGNNHRIQKFDSSGNFLLKWGSAGSGDGHLLYPHGVAVDGSGNVYVTDRNNNRVQKFTSGE